MTCPICDQKPMNCDCSETERRQYSEIADMEELVDHLYEKIDSLRLTDEERVAVLWGIATLETDATPDAGQNAEAAAILRGLLDRLGPTGHQK